jgi:predicted DNA-binding protein
MEVNLTPELQARLEQWKAQTGRETGELVADAMASYLDEISGARETLDSRYDSIRNGEVTLVDGEAAFALLKKRTEDQRRRA